MTDWPSRHVPVASQQQLKDLYQASVRAWQEKRPVFRIIAAMRTNACLALWKERVPTNLHWVNDFLDPEGPLAEPFMEMCSYSAGQRDSSMALNAALAFATMQCLQVSDVPPWFMLSGALAHTLMATQLRGVYPRDVRTPFPGFYIELPAGILTLLNHYTDEHEVRAICVCEGNPQPLSARNSAIPMLADIADQVGYGRRLLIVAFCEPNHNSVSPEDDNILFFSLPLDDDSKTIETLLARDHDLVGAHELDDQIGGSLVGIPRTNIELRNLLRHFVINFLLYLGSPHADREHVHAARLQSLRRAKRTHRVREQITRLSAEPAWTVGSHLKIDPRITAAVRDAGTAQGRTAVLNVLVRGYWRRQWTGKKTPENPKGSDWHMVHIAPTIRNYDPATKVQAHEYEVK